MTIKELKEAAKDFDPGCELIFPLSVFTEDEVDKLIKEKILTPGKKKDIMDYEWKGVKDD